MCYYTSQLGNWYVKGYKGITYIVCTNANYPKDIAIECLDELYETVRQFKLTKWFRGGGGGSIGVVHGVGNKVTEIARKMRDPTISQNNNRRHGVNHGKDEYDNAAIKINACCKGIAIKYGTLDDGKSTWTNTNLDIRIKGWKECSTIIFRF